MGLKTGMSEVGNGGGEGSMEIGYFWGLGELFCAKPVDSGCTDFQGRGYITLQGFPAHGEEHLGP